MSEQLRFLIAFNGRGYAADAMAHVVERLEGAGHEVELVSYGGLAAETARSITKRGLEGLKAVARSVSGRLSGEDPLGLKKEGSKGGDVVVATSPELLSATKALAGDAVRVGLVPDLDWTQAWADSDADTLILPHPLFTELSLRKGWPEEALFTAGVPLPKGFSRTLDVPEIKGRFGLAEAKGAFLLCIAEDIDPSQLEKLVFQLSLVDSPVQPIFYFGEDKIAADALRKAAAQYGITARMFGLVPNLEEYYAACDLVLAESSSPLLYALLALDKPLLLLDKDELPVGAFLADEGAARAIPDVLRLGAELESILSSETLLEKMKAAASEVVDQKGAEEVVEALLNIAANKDSLRARGAHTKPAQEAQEAMGGGGAFEVIGGGTPTPDPTPQPQPEQQRKIRLFESHSSRHVSRAQAREEMASLILMERDAERRLADASRYVSLWEKRLDLARRATKSDLAGEAERLLDNYRREEQILFKELDRIRVQKEKLRRLVNPTGGAPEPTPNSTPAPDMEKRFRAMELDSDLDRLRKKLKEDYDD